MPDNGIEEVDVNTPSGQTVTVRVPSGWTDDQIRSNLRLKNPELFQGANTTPPEPSARLFPQGVPQGTITGPPQGGIQQKISNWLNSLESDVRHGGTETLPGKLLNKLGAKGTDLGVSPEVANQVASPILGPIKTAQGVAEGNPLKTAGGILQTSTLPSSFVSPVAAEAGINAIPSKAWGGKAINAVEQAAKGADLKVSPDAAGQVAMRIKEIASAGTTLPSPVRAFVNRVTKLAAKGPITFEEARDIYKNATGKLSPDDIKALSPMMRFQLGRFAQALHQDITAAATTIGQGPLYQEAMKNYHQAAVLQELAKKGIKAAATAAAGAGLYKGAESIINRR